MISAIKGISRDKIYQELRLESLADQRQSRKLISFCKIMLGLLPSYLQKQSPEVFYEKRDSGTGVFL